MQKIRAILLLCVIAAISAATVLYSGVSAAFYIMPSSDTASKTDSIYAASQESSPVSSPSAEENTASAAESSNASSAVVSSAVPTAQNSSVSGRIIEKHIDSSSASLSYEKVYIKNNAGVKLDIKSELAEGLSLSLGDASQPQVLIVHTHATESFMLTERDYYTPDDRARTTDTSKNMVAVGERMAEALKGAGISVLHDTTLHDYPSYNGSYTASAATIKSYLKKYPSIKVVIDLHRDAVSSGSDKVKLCHTVNGKKAAQVMLVMGSQSGNVTNYPNWKQNLRLAMRLHQKFETLYPGLARPILLVSSRYNQNLSSGAMLIEIGTDANTLDEALYSGTLVGTALGQLLAGM